MYQPAKPRSSMKKLHRTSNSSTKNIRFNESVRVQPIRQKSSNMTAEDKLKIYYSKEDMKRFQFEGRETCKVAAKRAVSLSASSPALSASEHFSHMIESDPTLRGLESLVCPTRLTNRSMVNKAVLSCQKELNALKPPLSPQEREVALSQVYASISCCSKLLGMLTAKSDTAAAYMTHPLNTSLATTGIALPSASSTKCQVPNTTPVTSSRSIPLVSPLVESKRAMEFMPTDQQQHKRRGLSVQLKGLM